MVDSMDVVLTDVVPNGHSDEVVNAISGKSDESDEQQQFVTVSGIGRAQNVLITTASGNLFDEDSLKGSRIIIHDQSSLDDLENTQQTITFNPLNRSISVPEKNINWDPSVDDTILAIRCRNVRGELHKSKFGSGNRGRCILVDGTWCTPSEFEALCGRGNSKDWKRSIRHGGRSLMCLIDQGILRPHAQSCTCFACSDDNQINKETTPEIINGPVRLFTPYKRRKRHHTKLKVSTDVKIASSDSILSAPVELPPGITINGVSDSVATIIATAVPFITAETGNIICQDSVIVAPEAKPQTSTIPTVFEEQKQWWQLEEMVKNVVRQALDIQKQVEVMKNQCNTARETALQELRAKMENDKKEHCANCNREAISECTGCHRVFYCSAFCQKKDWTAHKEECGDNIQDADCSELINDCDDTTN